ncbi:hypothetical protein GALMADRAFT_781071 [Galerina marginata CBS 339.88]|uniref:Protein kinase domain-containing protein n=1 Tax=Galerina marginata (strain CBS 339.88) TaxID=685588 RepID=A0A067SYG8_GALM3|nr:hypothetical protein GALMADRAFT_781071 [Galerina marginata CBS 339.88]
MTNPDDLTGLIVRNSVYPAHGGGYADVYAGILSKNGLTTKVAVKVIRAHTYTEANQWKIDKRLRREIRVWSCLRHPNIVPLLGTTMSFGLYVAMVCPWMNKGNLNHYLNDKKAELNLRRRLQILTDIVEGLSYLHAQPVVHGDLTTGNILIDDGKAQLSDFGLSNVMAEVRSNSLMSSTVGGAPRWAAPELYHFGTDLKAVPEVTKYCDIYSFGSVALQVISGRIPYEEIASDIHVMMEIMKGRNPTRPAEPLLSDEFWNFIVFCWNRDPSVRPEIDVLREALQILRYSCSEEALAARIIDADKPPEQEPLSEGE